jgi:P27 family predicted phage terminase small subunit
MNFDKWDKAAFICQLTEFLETETTEQDRLTILIFAESVEGYVQCTQDIQRHGLVVVHHNGVTGKTQHVGIRDKALARCLQIMAELKLTPKYRLPPRPKISPELEAFMRGPLGRNEVRGDDALESNGQTRATVAG